VLSFRNRSGCHSGRRRNHSKHTNHLRSQLGAASDTSSGEHNFTESEDVDAVKQLTGMGFQQGEAVAALERSSYDFQRALNSLVGSV
jgi:hypothetical protein